MIDSHHHLWHYNETEYGWISEDTVIRRSFEYAELDALLETSEIKGAIAVQARCHLKENNYLLKQASQSKTIQGVVGWVDLKSMDVDAQLDRYANNATFKGVREIIQGEPDEKFLTHADFQNGIRALTRRGLTYDVLIYQEQIESATRFIDEHPNQTFVLDHGAKPKIKIRQFPENWEKNIREMAKRDHLVCKLSGLVTEVRDKEWNVESLRRYVDVLLDAFGPSRLMFGSDWPVCLLASQYSRWIDAVCECIAHLSETEQNAILTQTATDFYSLK